MYQRIVDFFDFDNPEEAFDAWLQPSLSLNVAVNLPQQNTTQAHDDHEEDDDDDGVNDNNNVNVVDIIITPPFPWATNQLAKVHSLHSLFSRSITTVTGLIQCRRCEVLELDHLDLCSKYRELKRFAFQKIHTMHQRAPKEWMVPAKSFFKDCRQCGQANSMKPVVSAQREQINWLFLFLAQSLGVCNIGQLKWFCKYNNKHRTGAKDRVLCLTYVSIGTQLEPQGVFNGW